VRLPQIGECHNASSKKVAKKCRKLRQLPDASLIRTFMPHAEAKVKPFWLLVVAAESWHIRLASFN